MTCVSVPSTAQGLRFVRLSFSIGYQYNRVTQQNSTHRNFQPEAPQWKVKHENNDYRLFVCCAGTRLRTGNESNTVLDFCILDVMCAF